MKAKPCLINVNLHLKIWKYKNIYTGYFYSSISKYWYLWSAFGVGIVSRFISLRTEAKWLVIIWESTTHSLVTKAG